MTEAERPTIFLTKPCQFCHAIIDVTDCATAGRVLRLSVAHTANCEKSPAEYRERAERQLVEMSDSEFELSAELLMKEMYLQ